jgi:hypothetical protein
MEGYDNTWREATADKSAYYLNVPYGSYSFRVKVFNSDGIKSEKAMQIIIKPPWWKTWWGLFIRRSFIYSFHVGHVPLPEKENCS